MIHELQTEATNSKKEATILDSIEVNPNVCHGKPVIRGTRIMVRNILGSFACGDSIHDILQNYPEITYENIEAAIAYAIELVDVWTSDDFDTPLEFRPNEK